MSTSEANTIPCRWLNDPNCNVAKHLSHKTHTSEAKFYNNILEAVGHTPMVRLNKIPKAFGLDCEILVKCEYLNPGGSIKDRVSLRMVEDAEKVNALNPGSTIIEATSGNTGIGLSLVAAVKGYNMIITLPEKMSQEKVNVMKGLGAQVLRTPTEAASTHPDSHFSLARRLVQELPNSTILDQFSNSSNPLAHYDCTANEIIEQCGDKLDFFFAGAGTGGTLTGCASRLKEVYPNIRCIGVDPSGSMIADPNAKNPVKKPYHIEGIGGDFVPNTCVHGFINEWIKTDDKESFDMARMLIKDEGLLVGGSSGAAVAAAVQYALKHGLGEKDRIVVILPDSVRNYVNKFLDDDWMVEKGFLSNEIYLNKKSKLYGKKASDLKLKPIQYYKKDLTVDQAFQIFENGAEVIPIVENDKIRGIISANKLLCPVENKGLEAKDTIEKCIIKDFISVNIDTDLSIVQKLLEKHQVVFVEERDEEDEDDYENCLKLYAISGKDLLRAYNKGTDYEAKDLVKEEKAQEIQPKQQPQSIAPEDMSKYSKMLRIYSLASIFPYNKGV